MADQRLSATSREPEEFARATEVARETREQVAAQVAALIIEGDQMGGRSAFGYRVRQVLEAEARIQTAERALVQARLSGQPEAPSVRAIAEGKEVRRSAVMDVCVSAAQWVAAIDHAAKVASAVDAA